MITAIGVIIILVGIGLIGVSIWLYSQAKENETKNQKVSLGKYSTSIILGVVAIVMAIILFTSVATIPAGHRGVVLKWGGEVEQRVMNEGLNFKIPFVESVVAVDIRVQAHPFEKIDAASKEMQTVTLTGKVNWHFDPAKAYTIYQSIGASSDFVNKILDSALNDFLKEATPQYSVNDMLNQRTEIRNTAIRTLGNNLSRYFIIIDDIYIADIQFSPEYLAAIEKQQVAERQVNTERNLLEQIRIKAEQAKVEAEGKANASAAAAEGEKRAAILKAEGGKQSLILQAEAEQQSKILIADGQATAIETVAKKQAEANKLLAQSISQNLINYNYVNNLSPNVKVMLLPSGQPLILTDAFFNSTNDSEKDTAQK